jgi:archaellum component FlaC
MSKKTLMNDWQKSIFEMERRDKALQAIKDMITQKNDEIMQLDSEISGLKTETRAEQNESEKLHDKLSNLRKDVEMVQ